MHIFGKSKKKREHLSRHLNETTEKVQNTDLRTGNQKAGNPLPVSDEDIFNYFVKAGIDYNGQLNSCYDEMGKGITGKMKVDPAAIFLPGTTASISGSVSAKIIQHTLVVLQRQPEKHNPDPIFFGCMIGGCGELTVKVEAEAGFKTPELLPSSNLCPECLSYSLEAKAVANAGIQYEGKYLHISDPAPQWYSKSDRNIMIKHFANVTKGKSTEKMVKDEALQLFAKSPYTKKFRPRFISSVGTERLIDQLFKARKARGLTTGLHREIRHAIRRLQPYRKTYPFKEFCSLKLWGHSGNAHAGVTASATASISVNASSANVTGGLSAEVKGPSIKGEIKKTIYRFQTYIPKKPKIVITQDTTITYKQIRGDIFKASIGAEASLSVGNVERGVDVERDNGKDWVALNSMAYRSAVAYWNPPSSETTGNVDTLQGSGYVFGQSVIIENLKPYYKIKQAQAGYDEESDTEMDEIWLDLLEDLEVPAFENYLSTLAASLRVSVENLKEFLDDGNTRESINTLDQDPGFDSKAILLEASFEKKGIRIEVKHNRKTGECKLGEIRKKMVPEENHNDKLQSIRLRYRIADNQNKDHTKFTLGFKFLSQEVGISLEEVDRAGSEGIVDISTYWFGSLTNGNTNAGASALAYEKAVPPVALLCQ